MTMISLFNPLSRDFSVTYDINNDKHPITFTIPSFDVAEFDPVVADHIKKHLADAVLNERGVKTNWEADHKDVCKEIELQ